MQKNVFGIRQAKAHLSQLVRAAAKGETSIVTDNRSPVAMIGPLHFISPQSEAPPLITPQQNPPSEAKAFRRALFDAPFPLDLDF